MKCPDCLLKIHQAAENCPHCGLSFSTLRQRFQGLRPVIDDWVLDSAGVLRKKMRDSLVSACKKLRHQFPNVQLAICFVDLPQETSIESYGCWLLNDGVFRSEMKEMASDECRIIIVIDLTNKAMTISMSYLFDGVVKDGETFDLLAAGHAYLLEGELAKGGKAILNALRNYLKKLHRRIGKELGK